MRKSLSLTFLSAVLLLTAPALARDISNFLTPFGFRTPLLEQGQLALGFNPHYYRYESQQDPTSDDLVHSESVQKQYDFSLNGIYALTDALIFEGSLVLYPGQIRSTSRYVWTLPYGDGNLVEYEIKEHSEFVASPGVGLSFRPRTNVQFYGDFRFRKERGFSQYSDYEYDERMIDFKVEDIYSNLGFTILGRLSGDEIPEGLKSRIFKFLRPYGFRAPLIDQGQYAVSFNFLYERTEMSEDWVSDPNTYESTWERYYFLLNGLYALTERLLFQGALEVYPAQTRETKERKSPSVVWDYDELHSDFMIVPCFTASWRPRVNMEFYGVFRFIREDLREIRPPDLFDSQVRKDIYYLELGYTILGKGSARASAPIPGSEFSNFFTLYGFRTPMLQQGQYAVNVNSRYERTESEEHYPQSIHRENDRSLEKTYYFSLNGVYAVIDELIFECDLDIFPGQTRVTNRYRWREYPEGFREETDEQHSDFTVSPRLEVSFRPQERLEFYGAFYFNKEKTYIEDRPGHHTNDWENERFCFDLGFTILGDL
jgi:hypothetical protein